MDLGKPDFTILVNVLKSVCGIAIVPRFKELSKFNIRTLAAPPEKEGDGADGVAPDAPQARDGATPQGAAQEVGGGDGGEGGDAGTAVPPATVQPGDGVESTAPEKGSTC